jgi:hypothetical protein
MVQQTKNPPALADPIQPAVLPDVTTYPHPPARATPPSQRPGGGRLQEVLPEIKELAQKVGGFNNLAEIAKQLDRAGS